MPSVAEGFGLPVAEALGCGVPVIASGLPVYREFAGDVPDYLEAHDVSGWAAQVEAYCEPGSTARLAQLARLEGWQPPCVFERRNGWLCAVVGQAAEQAIWD